MDTDLPPNLGIYHKNGVTFYRYRFPDGQRKGLGSDRARAVALAHGLNSRLQGVNEHLALERSLVASGKGRACFIGPVIQLFIQDVLLAKRYAATTIASRKRQLQEYQTHWQLTPLARITTFDIAQFLKSKSAEQARQHRNLLMQLFTYAVEEGLIGSNPVTATAPRKQPPRTRQRHTWHGYSAILAAAEPWLQRAMKLALYSVQRRGDLLTLHRDQVNLAARTIRITQHKTKVDLLISMGNDLFEVVKECMTDGVPCPYLVHMRPKRLFKKGKRHPFAVTESYLTHAFSAARDQCGAYDHLPPALRPSFHDLRALGIFALHKAGFSELYIQALAGHADAAMTRHYMAGHEQAKPLQVEAGLSVDKVDWAKIEWQQ